MYFQAQNLISVNWDKIQSMTQEVNNIISQKSDKISFNP